jgi:hypothetical protein
MSSCAQGGSSPVVALAAVGGYFVLNVALALSFGLPSLPALALLLLVLAMLLLVARRREWGGAKPAARRWLGPAVRGVAILHFAGFCIVTLGLAHSTGVPLAPMAFGVVVFGLILASYLSSGPPPRWLRGRFAGLLTAAGLLGGCQIALAPPPTIDTWGFQQEAARFLLRGDNPYDSMYPHMGDEDYYAPASVVDGHMQTYPYMPLQLLLTLPGYLLGDVRWVMLAALLGAAAFTAAAGGRSQASQTAAALLLCSPLNPLVIAQSWSEPLLTLQAVRRAGGTAAVVGAAPRLAHDGGGGGAGPGNRGAVPGVGPRGAVARRRAASPGRGAPHQLPVRAGGRGDVLRLAATGSRRLRGRAAGRGHRAGPAPGLARSSAARGCRGRVDVLPLRQGRPPELLLDHRITFAPGAGRLGR